MKNTQSAAVLLIGNELLSGRIQDQNLAHIAITLEQRGIRVRETRIIPDIEQEIVEAINHLRHKYDYVFTTGGIGPTHDDITSDSIAKAFGVNNVIQKDAFSRLKAYFDHKGYAFSTAAQRMAHAPEGAELIKNEVSIAPGYRLDNIYVMAGVPSIMRNMLATIAPSLDNSPPILTGTIHANVGESEIAESLHLIQEQHPDIDIGSYPQEANSQHSNYRVIFVVRGTNQPEITDVSLKIEKACQDLGHEAVVV